MASSSELKRKSEDTFVSKMEPKPEVPHQKYVKAISQYFRSMYGIDTAQRLLTDMIIIEKNIKMLQYQSPRTPETIFTIFYTFSQVLAFIRNEKFSSDSKGYPQRYYYQHDIEKQRTAILEKYGDITPIALLRISIYLTYSFIGPSVEYPFSTILGSYTKKIDWKKFIVDLIMNTDYSANMLRLHKCSDFFQDNVESFLDVLEFVDMNK